MNPVQGCPPTGGSANHSFPLWAHLGPSQWALQPPSPQVADECSIKLHWGKGSTFSNPVSCLNHCCRVNFMERPPEKPATGTGSWEGKEQRHSRPCTGYWGSNERGCGMSSHLQHHPGLRLSTSISHDRKSTIKCCLLRAGHVFGNCAAFKPLPQNAVRLEVNLQLVLLLKPEKGESACKTHMCFTSKNSQLGPPSSMQRSSSRD